MELEQIEIDKIVRDLRGVGKDDGWVCASIGANLIEALQIELGEARKDAANMAAAFIAARNKPADEYEFEIWQNEGLQAGGSASTVDEAVAEANHYAMMYRQDGEIEVRYFERRRLPSVAGVAP